MLPEPSAYHVMLWFSPADTSVKSIVPIVSVSVKTTLSPSSALPTSFTRKLSACVPAGTFDLELCPVFDDLLVAEEFPDQTLSANVFLGTVFLDPGVVLSGAVQGSGGGMLAGVDVDVGVGAGVSGGPGGAIVGSPGQRMAGYGSDLGR